MAQLKRMQYRVLMDDGTDEGTEHVVTVIHGDQIRASATARSRKVPGLDAAPLDHASLWAWHAMTRLELTDLRYTEWVDKVLALQPLEDDDGTPQLVPVDPT